MRMLNTPSVSDFAVTRAISEAKQWERRRTLRGLGTRLYDVYKNYENVAPALEKLRPLTLTLDEQKALQHAYESDTKPLQDLYERLLSPIDVNLCPYCGIGETTTLDHYLPRDAFKEYAVFSKNLVPCCGPCNETKGAKYLDASGSRIYLHPYYEDVPATVQLSVRISLRRSAIVFNYYLECSQPPICPTIESQFQELHLAQRYRKKSLSHLRKRLPAFRRYYGPDKNAQRVADALNSEADSLMESMGRNAWEVVLDRALADCQKFCDGGFTVLSAVQ